jgi:hypothetical protein
VKVVFSMRHLGFARLFEPVLRALPARGHALVVAAERRGGTSLAEPVASIARDYASIQWHPEVSLTRTPWSELGTAVRLWLDYLRFLEPRYHDTPKLRARAEEQVPRILVALTSLPLFKFSLVRQALRAVLGGIERAIPPNPGAIAYLRDERPDVILLTPLVYIGSPQVETLRAAKALGLRTALAVGSWDHLSSKALIRDVPDRVLVWNETQRQEAIELHGVAPERVVVTGAQCYDQWFDRVPDRSREDFCADMGLPADRPFILYVGSALFLGSRPETDFVRRWIEGLRAAGDERTRAAGILIRPHPARRHEWESFDLTRLPEVRIRGANPVDERAKADYFDALYYSSAVVGLNTSAFLEAAIAGRPVLSIALPEFQENQEGTLHFRYLRDGGLLHLSRTLDEHISQVGDALAGRLDPERNERFVRSFIRPYGPTVAGTARFVEAVEWLAGLPPPEPVTASLAARLARAPLYPLAGLARLMLARDERVLAANRVAREELRVKEHEAFAQEKTRRRLEAEERSRREREEKVRRAEEKRAAVVAAREAGRLAAAREKAAHRHAKEQDKERRVREKQTRARRERVRDALARRLELLFGRPRDVR